MKKFQRHWLKTSCEIRRRLASLTCSGYYMIKNVPRTIMGTSWENMLLENTACGERGLTNQSSMPITGSIVYMRWIYVSYWKPCKLNGIYGVSQYFFSGPQLNMFIDLCMNNYLFQWNTFILLQVIQRVLHLVIWMKTQYSPTFKANDGGNNTTPRKIIWRTEEMTM